MQVFSHTVAKMPTAGFLPNVVTKGIQEKLQQKIKAKEVAWNSLPNG